MMTRKPMEEWEREVELTTARQTNTRLRPAVRDLWSSLLAGRVVVMIGDSTSMNVCKSVQAVVQTPDCPVRDDTMFSWRHKPPGAPGRSPRKGAGALCCIKAGYMPLNKNVPNVAAVAVKGVPLAQQVRIARPISLATCRAHVERNEAYHLGVAAPWMHANIGDALQCLHLARLLHPRDVVVANSGLHHNDMSTLRANVVSFIEYYKLAAQANMNVMWRETIPQHWATRFGVFAWHLHNSSARGKPYCCVPLPVKRPHGKQKWNVMAEPLLRVAGVPVVQYFGVFDELHHLHRGCHDCTHYIENATDMRAANALGVNIRKLLRPGSEQTAARAAKSSDAAMSRAALLAAAEASYEAAKNDTNRIVPGSGQDRNTPPVEGVHLSLAPFYLDFRHARAGGECVPMPRAHAACPSGAPLPCTCKAPREWRHVSRPP